MTEGIQTKKINMFLTICLSFIILFTSCASGDNSGTDPAPEGTVISSPGSVETQAPETEFSDGLPEESLDGYSYRLFIRQGGRGNSMFREELNGDRLNDAIYMRDRAVEDRFDVSITVGMFSADDYGMDCVPTLLAGDDAFDLLAPHGRFAFEIALQGLTYEWGLLPYVDLDKDWWDPGARESFTIHDKLYTTTGDICYNNLGQTFCFLFNKTLFDEASLAYPYQSVLEGTWTWDEWERILEVCDSDLDGNGVMEPSVDRFGYMTHIWSGLINMQFAAGLSIVSVVDGEPEISFMSEKTVEVYDRYFSHILPKVNIEVDEGGAFRSGRVFFMDGSMNSAIGFRDMDDDFGIIPFPKYAEDMEYRNAVEGGTNLFLVPITVKDLNASSIILEGMASESWRHLTPEFYEVVLKTKHVRDPESAEILDIIRRSRVFDFGYYNMTIGLDSIPVNLYQTYGNAENLVSFYQKKDKVARKSLEKLMQSYEKIAEAQQEMLP